MLLLPAVLHAAAPLASAADADAAARQTWIDGHTVSSFCQTGQGLSERANNLPLTCHGIGVRYGSYPACLSARKEAPRVLPRHTTLVR